jgi:MYND finger
MAINMVSDTSKMVLGKYHIFRLRLPLKYDGTSELARTIMDRNAPLSCDYCGEPDSKDPDAKKLLRCGKCKTEKYCDKQCQKNDWKIHKKHCYTPAQMSERAKTGNAPGSRYVGGPLSGFAMSAIIDPIENAHASR